MPCAPRSLLCVHCNADASDLYAQDELDRRGQEIEELRTLNADLAYTTDTLKSELEQANNESATLSDELAAFKSKAIEHSSDAEGALRLLQEDVESLRSQREEWEMEASRERLARENAERDLTSAARELETGRADLSRIRAERDREKESAENLSLVLQEFQEAKDRELEATTGDLRDQLHAAQKSLSEYRNRATAAEVRLEACVSVSSS